MPIKPIQLNKIEYHYLYTPGLPGVDKKIAGSVSSLNQIGHPTELKQWRGNFITKRLMMLVSIATSRASVLIIRHDCFLPICYVPSYLLARALGKKIIIDIPTPLITAVSEFSNAETNPLIKACKIALLLLQHPLSLLPATIVLQYAHDNKFLTLLTQKKTILVANGYNVSEVQKADLNERVNTESGNLNFLAIGTIADWHGYDRLLHGLRNYYQSGSLSKVNISINFIGDGPALKSLKALTERYDLSDRVKFHGQITGTALTRYLNIADLGIGTLGLHRKGLSLASPLKNREYCAYGLPFICSHEDIDFTNQEFALSIPANDSAVDIQTILDYLASLKQKGFNKNSIHLFALENIDFQAKWMRILSKLTISNFK